MRPRFDKQLETLHTSLIHMGALCEDIIANAAKALLDGNENYLEKTAAIEDEINFLEHDIEQMCFRLILHEQPVAGDLRRINAAQKMITDMERIGDQGLDIAELSVFMKGSPVKSDIHIGDMARATIKMVTESIDSFVNNNLELAKAVIDYDDVVDDLFTQVKQELVQQLLNDSRLAGECLDLLMIAKYFERIGDHATNIAEWVLYTLTGSREITGPEGMV
ncbi:MAG: phoU [Evtepia sp.]|nr:phoU [Evtepia sp.]